MILGIGCLIHVLTIAVIWSIGRAQGLVLPVTDAAVLFTVTVGVTLVPISIGGWGLRELAVISLPRQPRHCAGTGIAVLGVLRLRPGD